MRSGNIWRRTPEQANTHTGTRIRQTKICRYKGIDMTDEQIIKNLQAVLDTIHHPESGIFQELNLEQKRTLEQDLADKRNIDIRDVRFDLSGREIFEQKLGDLISCTGMTKVFLYAAKNSGLDLKAVITTETECLNNGHSNNGHVVPAVKMSDGKYHIFEPRAKNAMGKNFQKMLSQPVVIGENVFHILNSIKDKPYEVIDIITAEQLEQIKTMDDIIEKSRRKES